MEFSEIIQGSFGAINVWKIRKNKLTIKMKEKLKLLI